MISNNFLTKSFLLLSLCALASCIGDDVQKKYNEDFQRKFSSKAAKINEGRVAPPRNYSDNNQVLLAPTKTRQTNNDPFASADEIVGVAGAGSYSSANIDTTKFALKESENFLPDEKTFIAAKAVAQKFPDDMFELNYNTDLSSAFVHSGLEFDNIQIPDYDYYGIASNLNNKQYVLAGNQNLQPKVDRIIKARSREDVEFSEVLIKEQKALRKKQKLIKIFGEDSSFVEKEKAKDDNEQDKKTAEIIDIDGAIRKQIALQIIKQNIEKNNGINPDGTPKQTTQQ